ncbi:transcription factor bHLH110-like isoform X1 [Zingiber officinale]|uniref:BHLH domain-containing protein n=1 Tax=Zingiber officinale TaxID=94328 RepID=A0A8J5F3G9_ZINOF|nr:transcription factor bHLH110-like isoform X1 [Zingiber officinale]KAG6477508.1 hypothetical protein ZIOFF_066775 [Zingiber officinale]
MMGSPRLDHYHQEELHGLPPFDLATNQILNYGTDFSLVHEMSPVSSQMIQELGFLNQQLSQEKLKEEELLECSGLLQPLPTNLSEISSLDYYYYYNCETLEAPDLSASSKSGRSICHPSVALMRSLLGEDGASGHGHHLQESIPSSYSLHQKMPSLVSGPCSSTWEHHRSPQTPTPCRKPRLEQRSPFPPFKVRKEKLGDRIAALQQLVAPFGKTDTASVLMEAIGYIKFLLDQVEKLSVPYMKSSGNKRSRTMIEASKEKTNIETKRDLRSRGLCLVPLSCTSYMTSEQGVWSPSNYGGSG